MGEEATVPVFIWRFFLKPTLHKKSLLFAVAFAFALVTGSVTPSYAFLDKTRFVAHLGVAYFCFHHWVLKPYGEGKFASGAPHRFSTIVKGGAALLFAVHEVQVAEKIARNSKSPLLQKLDGALVNIESEFGAVGQKLKGGHFDPSDVASLSNVTDAFKTQANAEGVQVKDVPAPVPGS
ncbi:MAG TPA: hypothetical protein VGD50_00465 [Candidatus Baltobacteraceae bacterium]